MDIEPPDISIEEYNERVAQWGSDLGTKIRTSIRMLANKGKGDLVKSLRLKTAKWYGELDKLSYHFLRHGVFVHKGVGRGYYMEGGRVIRGTKPGEAEGDVNYRLHQAVLRSARVQRKLVEWFNPVVESNIDKLADMVAELNADRVVNATRILIR